MGLTPIMWTRLTPTSTFDTNGVCPIAPSYLVTHLTSAQDFNIAGGLTGVSQVLQNWEFILNNASTLNSGFIVLEHDLFQQSVEVSTGYILPDALAHRFDIKPIISCLNQPLSNAYIETNDNKTNPPPAMSGMWFRAPAHMAFLIFGRRCIP